MAYNRATTLFLVALILFQLSNPLAQAQAQLGGLSVSGQVFCSPDGNSPGSPLVGTVVNLNCTILGAAIVIGRNTTDANGFFNITVPTVRGLLLGLPSVPCVATVRLPLNSTVCPILSTTTGVIASAVQSVGTVVTPILGLVQRLTVVGFFRVRI